MKLTLAQTNHIMKNLKRIAGATVAQLEDHIREALVPPKVSTKELKSYLTKLAYDKPVKLVSLILKKEPWPIETERLAKRTMGFASFHEAMSSLRSFTEGELLRLEGQLLFDDTWTKDYPVYLEEELVATIVDYINGGGTDDDQ